MKPRRGDEQSGLAMLEASFLLIIFIPILLVITILCENMYTCSGLDEIVSRYSGNTSFQPFQLITGNQGYFLYNESYRDLEREATHREFFEELAEQIEREVQEVIQCLPEDCPNLYRIEVRWAQIRINTDTGKWRNIVCVENRSDTSTSEGEDQEGPGKCPGYFKNVSPPGNYYYRVVGNYKKDEPGKNEEFRDEFFALRDSDRLRDGPSQFAFPSAMFHVDQPQYYGFTEIRENSKQVGQTRINYARGSIVIGVSIEVDLNRVLRVYWFNRLMESIGTRGGMNFNYHETAFTSPRQLF